MLPVGQYHSSYFDIKSDEDELMDFVRVEQLPRLLLHDADSFKRDVDGDARLVLLRRRQLRLQSLQRVFAHLHFVASIASQ